MVHARVLLVGLLVVTATWATFAGAAVGSGDAQLTTGRTDVGSAVTGATAPASGAPPGGATDLGTPGATPEQPATDTTVTSIEVFANGSARWTIEVRTRLETSEEADDYRAFQRMFRNDTERFLGPFRERMRGVVDDAARLTGRDMAVGNVTASTTIQEVPRRWGVVRYSFRWTNFARSDGDALVVGDVFGGGFFLARNDTLTVRAPEGYAVESVAPSPAEQSGRRVSWEGRVDFGDSRPSVRLTPGEGTTTAPPGEDGTTTPTGDPAEGGTLPAWLVPLAVALAVLGGGAALYLRSQPGSDGPETPGGADDAPLAGGAASSGGPAESAVMTDEEQVERLLADNGGRMRQADVADELDWSASKTSRVLSDMADDGRVEKLQLGRENLIELPDEE
jgi:hypothetical protein